MSGFDETGADYAAELSRRAGAVGASSVGDLVAAEWARSGLDTIGGTGAVYRAAYDELVAGIEKASGMPIRDYARAIGHDVARDFTPDQRAAALAGMVDSLPADKRKELEPLRDIRRRAAEKAQAIERTAAETEAGGYGLTGTAAMYAAGVARAALDPAALVANIATAEFGGGILAGGALRMIARQGLAGAAGQAAVEPFVESSRAELGLEAGFGHGAGNVVSAAIGSAGIAAVLRGGAFALRRMRGPAAIAADDLHAAADVAERDQVIDTQAPAPGHAGEQAHVALVETAAHALENREPVGPLLQRFPRLAELQLGDIARTLPQLEETAAQTRGRLDTAEARAAPRAAAADELAQSAATLRAEAEGVRADLAATDARIAELGPATDEATQARLGAIASDLAAPALAAEKRAALEAERASITETLAKTAPQDERLRASLAQERAGLARALARQEKALAKAEAAAGAATERAGGEAARVALERKANEALLGSKREIVTNELRRAITRLAREGYGLALPRDVAEYHAGLIGLATRDELAGILRGVTDDLRARAGLAPLDAAPAAPRLLSDAPLPEMPKREAAPPAEPPAAAARATGDPALAADTERVLAEAGGDLEIQLPGTEEGTTVKISARQALAESAERDAAAREFEACVAANLTQEAAE